MAKHKPGTIAEQPAPQPYKPLRGGVYRTLPGGELELVESGSQKQPETPSPAAAGETNPTTGD